mmetsp:Transcript_89992/g.234280  ORF Transcript_89992/g.234280 Transcript_89992/m.234280 type:complete len:264 (-) Transcript_89992:379-1170(-)
MGRTGWFFKGGGSVSRAFSNALRNPAPSASSPGCGTLEQQMKTRHGSLLGSLVIFCTKVDQSGGKDCGLQVFTLTFFPSHLMESASPFFGSALLWNCGHQFDPPPAEKTPRLKVSHSTSTTWLSSFVTSSFASSTQVAILSDCSTRMSTSLAGACSPNLDPTMYFFSKSSCLVTNFLDARSSSFISRSTSVICLMRPSLLVSLASFLSICFMNFPVCLVACLVNFFSHFCRSMSSLRGKRFFATRSSSSKSFTREGTFMSRSL